MPLQGTASVAGVDRAGDASTQGGSFPPLLGPAPSDQRGERPAAPKSPSVPRLLCTPGSQTAAGAAPLSPAELRARKGRQTLTPMRHRGPRCMRLPRTALTPNTRVGSTRARLVETGPQRRSVRGRPSELPPIFSAPPRGPKNAPLHPMRKRRHRAAAGRTHATALTRTDATPRPRLILFPIP